MCRFRILWLIFCAPSCLLVRSDQASASNYAFMLESPSGVDISQLHVSAQTEGTLIGNFDAGTNPTGTRTKPGLFGSFGDDENVPVPVELSGSVEGAPHFATMGGFDAELDLAGMQLLLSNYHAAMPLGTDPSLTLAVGFGSDGFRTRSPTSLFPPGSVTVPFGSATLMEFELQQVGSMAPVALNPVIPGVFSFSALLPVTIVATVDVLENTLTLPAFPAVLPMDGTLDLTGPEALLMATAEFSAGQSQTLNQPLPDIPLPLPTVLPPGETADLVFRLMLTNLAGEFSAEVRTAAEGILVPEASTGLWAVCLFLGLNRTLRPGKARGAKVRRDE